MNYPEKNQSTQKFKELIDEVTELKNQTNDELSRDFFKKQIEILNGI